jgi:hypothetical protein
MGYNFSARWVRGNLSLVALTEFILVMKSYKLNGL